MQNIKALPGYVIIEVEEAQAKTAGGIYLPPSEAEKERSMGTVMSAGENISSEGFNLGKSVKTDQKVVFKKYGAYDEVINGKKCAVVAYRDLLFVYED